LVSLADRNIGICKIESLLLTGARQFFINNNYTEVNVPHLTNATGSCENMDTLFTLNWNNNKIFLAQTGQLYLETLVDNFGKVYCLSPSFRAESKIDNRHLIEFPLLEIEIKQSFEGLLTEIENIFESMFGYLIEKTKKYHHLILPPYPRIKYQEVIDYLEIDWGSDITREYEQQLIRNYNKPFFLTHFPIEMKFFNMKKNSKDSSIVNSADLILPFGGEAVGAAEREHEYSELISRLTNSIMYQQLLKQEKGLKDFNWYLDYYKSSRSLHSGCGIGLTRVVQYVTKNNDIRNCATYPVNKELIW